jgi:cytochrome c556
MRIVKCVLLAALTVSLVGVCGARVEEKKPEKEPQTIKAIMGKFHKAPAKDEDPQCKKFLTGKASEAEIKDILAAYEDLGKLKPPKGDADAWKARTTALLTAAKDLAAKKEGAADAYKKAVDCMSCHTAFRLPPPPKDGK